MATWPGTLPTIPLRDNYQEGQQPGSAIRTPTDTGPPKQRKRFTAHVKVYRVTWEMTGTQLDTFWTFYRATLGNGALQFDGLPVPRTGTAANHRFNVSEEPQVTAIGYDSYAVSCLLETLP